MFYSKKEKQIMKPLLEMINDISEKNYRITLQDETILLANIDTCYDTDNGLDEDEKGYEEFFACLFRIIEIIYVKDDCKNIYKKDGLLEITYHNYPKEVIMNE